MRTPVKNLRSDTWRQLIDAAKGNHEPLNDQPYMVDEEGRHIAVTDDWLDTPFVNNYGKSEARPFLLWTKRRIYFPVEYDGMVVVASVPRIAHLGEKPVIINPGRTAADTYNLRQPAAETENHAE